MTSPTIKITPIKTTSMIVPIRSASPLIVHNWSAKAKKKMLDSQQGIKSPKEVRNPEEEYEASFYRTKNGYGFPAVAFKAAITDTSRYFGKSLPKTQIRQFVFVKGLYSPADPQALVEFSSHSEPWMREDMVTVGINGTDLRYRAQFDEWTADLFVTFASSCIDQGSVLSLVDAAGIGVGIGEWRPEKGGDFGTFRVDETKKVEVVG